MAYNYNSNNFNRPGQGYGGSGQNRSGGYGSNAGPRAASSISTAPKVLPADYVDQAQKLMERLSQSGSRLTTSKLRSILSLISDIYNREMPNHASAMSPDDCSRLQMAKVRIAYEAGRDGTNGPVYAFIKDADLLSYIAGVGSSRAKFMDFARYMEALVAYHRFYGGKD